MKELFYGRYNNNLDSNSNNIHSKFYETFNNLIEILTKEGRALHSGILMVIIALFIYFLDDNNKYSHKTNSLIDLFKTN